jgi:hypothetical protein
MRTRIPAILLALALAACQPHQPQEVPPPPASPEESAPAPEAPPATAPAPADPTTTPAAPAQPAPDAPPPTEPAPAPQPTATAAVPAVESMAQARPGAKMSVAADLRYQFDGAMVEGQPVALHLAAIPRVAGTNLNVHVKAVPGLEVTHGTLAAHKVEAAGVYRQQLSVIRRAGAPQNLRVLVTMDMPEGTAFGFFTIPLDAAQARDGNTAQKLDSVKQR